MLFAVGSRLTHIFLLLRDKFLFFFLHRSLFDPSGGSPPPPPPWQQYTGDRWAVSARYTEEEEERIKKGRKSASVAQGKKRSYGPPTWGKERVGLMFLEVCQEFLPSPSSGWGSGGGGCGGGGHTRVAFILPPSLFRESTIFPPPKKKNKRVRKYWN